MKRLWDSFFREQMPGSRKDQALQMAKRTGAVVVLKGAGTVVADGERFYINDTGNPGMATGGTGDVLTGIISSLYGQGMEPFEAAVLGVYLHGLAGDIAILEHGEQGLIATDLVEHLGEAFAQTSK
jgi:NAD(P)H-hydrate epimerase